MNRQGQRRRESGHHVTSPSIRLSEKLNEPPMPNESWIDRLTELQKLLAVCPRDVLARCDLAALLEELGRHEEALFHWKAVVASDANNLKAWEGMTRCRKRTGRPPQSHI